MYWTGIRVREGGVPVPGQRRHVQVQAGVHRVVRGAYRRGTEGWFLYHDGGFLVN